MTIKRISQATDMEAANSVAANIGCEHCVKRYDKTAYDILMSLWDALAQGGYSESEAEKMLIEEYNSFLDDDDTPDEDDPMREEYFAQGHDDQYNADA